MKMTRLEKRLVNREKKAGRNIVHLERGLRHLDWSSVHDVLEIGCGIGSVSAYLAQSYPLRVTGTDFDALQDLLVTDASTPIKVLVIAESALSESSARIASRSEMSAWNASPPWRKAISA